MSASGEAGGGSACGLQLVTSRGSREGARNTGVRLPGAPEGLPSPPSGLGRIVADAAGGEP